MPEPILTTARTPRHGLPYLFAGQAQKEAFVNEALARLDALVQPAVAGELAEPPVSPAPGDCYIVATPAAGAWAGHERQLASWAESQWLFAEPREGARVHDAGAGAQAVFTAAEGWRRAIAPAAPSGGAVQDAEARASIAALADALRALAIFSA